MARRRKKPNPAPLNLPVADEGLITETTVYPTIEAAWSEFTNYPWFNEYSAVARRVLKFAFYTGISEALRTVAFRMNAEQADTVFSDMDKELRAFDLELQRAAEAWNAERNAELH